jgi:hypothetical protein
LAQYVVRRFNSGDLDFLICTSTLIEGVNTQAKNVVIYDHKIAKRSIDYFTFNNIRGRSGRMFKHFLGRAYLFEDPPQEELPFVDFPLYTQGPDAATELLMQIDDADLLREAKERVDEVKQQKHLSYEIIRANSSIEP